jgi:tRNA G18 (ribose-2'-O)-methylase SpoU
VLSNQATELNSFRFPERTAIVMGNETQGIDTSFVANCREQLSISMLNGTDSLNVAVAAGIFGYAYRVIHPDGPHVDNGDIA